jgi:hypothetical protein
MCPSTTAEKLTLYNLLISDISRHFDKLQICTYETLKKYKERKRKAYITSFEYKLTYNFSSLGRDMNWLYV